MKNISNDVLYKILSQNVKTMYSVLELLDWDENFLGEIQGEVTDGSLNLSGDSAIRRTLSLGMIVNESNARITEVNNHISLNKKVKVKIGVTNQIEAYKDLGDIVWFNLGTFVFTDGSLTNDVSNGASLSLSAIDKMGLLSGDIGGQIQAPTEVHVSYDVKISEDGKTEYDTKLLTIYEMIRYAVIGLGGEDPAKVIINDVPLEIRTPIKYTGKHNMYYDAAGTPYMPDNSGACYYPKDNDGRTEKIDPDNLRPGYKAIKPDNYAGYELVPFTYPGELIKQPGDTITSILDSIKNVLGNYEYFYDVNGNFIFQEVKNFINTSFTPLTELENGDYIADFTKQPIVFSFKDKDVISAYSNAPDWKNIKNDFIVWGMPKSGSAQPVMYHLAVDEKPTLPSGYDKPWQKYLIEYGDEAISNSHGQDLNTIDAGRYYHELKGKFPQVYNFEEKNEEGEVIQEEGWKDDPAGYTYYLDFIDTKSEFGQYSINSIGKRTKSIIDDNVTCLYPPEITDIILIPALTTSATEEETQERLDYINHLNRIGLKYIQVDPKEWGTTLVSYPYAKDAFGVVRDLLFYHTTFNETITITSLPMYFLDANQMIEIENEGSNISGEYLIKSISLPLGIEGAMSISAMRSTPRI